MILDYRCSCLLYKTDCVAAVLDWIICKKDYVVEHFIGLVRFVQGNSVALIASGPACGMSNRLFEFLILNLIDVAFTGTILGT